MNARLRLFVGLVPVLLICVGCEVFSPTSPSGLPPVSDIPDNTPNPVPAAPISMADIILETNRHRGANGFSPLAENPKLNSAADFKMRDMFTRQYFAHFAPDRTSGIQELFVRFDYNYIAGGENLALGNFKNAGELVDLWVASPGHRANILSSSFREIGVAAGYDVFEGRKTIIAVQIFGTSRN